MISHSAGRLDRFLLLVSFCFMYFETTMCVYILVIYILIRCVQV